MCARRRCETLFAIRMNDMPGSSDNGLLTVGEQMAAQEASGAYLGMTPQESAALGQIELEGAVRCKGAGDRLLRRGG